MRVTEHLDRTPHVKVDLTRDLDANPIGYVQLRATEHGPVISVSADNVDHLLALSEAFKDCARRLQAAQIAQQIPAAVA